jgi:hypothetical protein
MDLAALARAPLCAFVNKFVAGNIAGAMIPSCGSAARKMERPTKKPASVSLLNRSDGNLSKAALRCLRVR